MRLFTAAVPPPEVADHLAAALADAPDPTFRVPMPAWHITIGYYGEDTPAERAAWVTERASGIAAPRVALGEMANFGETLFMSVTGDLGPLAAALRWNDKHPVYTPHLTIGKGQVTPLGYRGPEWTVEEVVLLGAEERYEYTVVDRVRLS